MYIMLMLSSFMTSFIRADDYAVVVDAGSTGSRIFVIRYSIENGKRVVTPSQALKIMPGISSFASHPEDVVEYFAPALITAISLVPEGDQRKTKLYIKATAGMRLIPRDEEDAIWATLVAGLKEKADIPLDIEAENFGT